jgi:Ca-activated chloride channel family protein
VKPITFAWPELLWLFALLPLLILLYVWLLRRKKKAAVRYANLGMIKEAMNAGPNFRRHVPPVLFLLALALLIVAMARPSATVVLPSQKQTIVLALDASGSMRAKDVLPSRLEAAQAAPSSSSPTFPARRRWVS